MLKSLRTQREHTTHLYDFSQITHASLVCGHEQKYLVDTVSDCNAQRVPTQQPYGAKKQVILVRRIRVVYGTKLILYSCKVTTSCGDWFPPTPTSWE